jgi:hypothetical protein
MSESSSITPRVSLPTMRRQRPQSQAERTRRINYVKKVIRKVYQKNKKEYSSKLQKTKKRDAINLQALTTFLRNSENSGLLNRIYEMSITPTGTLSVDALADRIDPATIPTIFSPRVPALEQAVETPAEMAEAVGREEDLQEELVEAQERLQEALQAEPREGLGLGEEIQRVATQQAQIPPFLQRAVGRVSTLAGISEALSAVDPEGEQARRREERLRAEASKRAEIKRLTEQKQKEKLRRQKQKLIQEEQRRLNVPSTSSANVPADPVENQREEARTNRLPSFPSMPSMPSVPRVPVPTEPIANAETIRIIESRVEDQGMRRVVRDVLSGNIDPNEVEDSIISAILKNLVGIPESITKAILNKLRSKMNDARWRRLIREAEITIPEAREEFREKEERIQQGLTEEEMEEAVDLDVLEDFQEIGTPQENVDRIRNLLESADKGEINEIANREYEKIVKKVIKQGAIKNLPNNSIMSYLTLVRNLFSNYANVPVITDEQVDEALLEADIGTIEKTEAEKKESKEGRQSRIVEGGTAGAVGGGIAGVASGGKIGAVGRLLTGGARGGVAGVAGGLAGGAVGKRVGGEKGERVGQVVGGLGAGVYAGYVAGSKMAQVQEVPVEIPDQVVAQEEPLKSGSGKGTLRPRFIIPTADILNKTDKEIQADLDEFSAFDYVIPSSEGTEGNISNNPLKRQAYIQNELILNGGGVDIPSQWGEEPMISEQEQKEQMIGDKLLPIPELKMGVVDEDISVGFYTRMAQPNLWNAGSIKLDPLYYGFTRATDLNDNIVRSSLYSYQY